jgi:hypothetical protein
MTGEKKESIVLDVHVVLPTSVQDAIDAARQQRKLAERSARLAASQSREAAKQMRGMGMTLRDIGMTLGVSYQRVHQLVND